MATTIEQYPLEKNKVLKRWVSAMLGWLFLEIVFLFAAIDAKITLLLLPLSFLVLAVWQWFYETKYFQAYFYDLTPDFLAIRKGWITPREVQLPYEKLQDVYMDQDLLDRVLGLWDVHVSTATMMSGMEAHVDGVNRENAEKIRELVLGKIRSKRGKVTGYD
jgi:putative membrane protein